MSYFPIRYKPPASSVVSLHIILRSSETTLPCASAVLTHPLHVLRCHISVISVPVGVRSPLAPIYIYLHIKGDYYIFYGDNNFFHLYDIIRKYKSQSIIWINIKHKECISIFFVTFIHISSEYRYKRVFIILEFSSCHFLFLHIRECMVKSLFYLIVILMLFDITSEYVFK